MTRLLNWKALRLSAFTLLLLSAWDLVYASVSHGPANVTQARLAEAVRPGEDWITHGGGWTEQRFSTLKQINDHNVGRLGLLWYDDLNTYRGVEATPLEIDGVLYNISAWDVTTAYDAVTGKKLWSFDPKIDPAVSSWICCGPVSRGVAAWHGKIIIATLDGRLIALDAKNGKPVWTADTVLDKGQPITMTGAPRIADGNVVIGNAGGDLGARGYITAWNADTGKHVWTFWIVPPQPGHLDNTASDSVAAMAQKTWAGPWWKYGGGGNDWDAVAYDPNLHTVFFGTGNGSPHPHKFRSAGKGDNLFICSIVAVDAKTGRYKWHYQEIPAEEWDYDCTSPVIMATLTLNRHKRDVIMHAPKDGIFYVLDRQTGKLLSAKPYMPMNWASGVDPKTGRPILLPNAEPQVKPYLITPGSGGGHNWNPMSYSPLTGLVYIPMMEGYMVESIVEDDQFKYVLGRTTINQGYANEPELRRKLRQEGADREKGYMLAWDPVHQREAFRIPYPHAGNGGTMVTAGNLLVQGTINKTFAIYRADNGQKLWELPVGSVPVSGPITYEVGGKQYIAVNVGWNSAIVSKLTNPDGSPFNYAPARLMVFALDAKGVSLPPAPPSNAVPAPPNTQVDPAQAARGEALYTQNCAICHGPAAVGGVKDLRHLSKETHADFLNIVLGGAREKLGMPKFGGKLTEEKANAIHAYLIKRAQDDYQPNFMDLVKRQ
ncbi:MAG: PQQ-dependent dehydrogenase, methanol/ethanol family [Croceibacterium sp.]